LQQLVAPALVSPVVPGAPPWVVAGIPVVVTMVGGVSYSGVIMEVDAERGEARIKYDGFGINRATWHPFSALELQHMAGERARRRRGSGSSTTPDTSSFHTPPPAAPAPTPEVVATSPAATSTGKRSRTGTMLSTPPSAAAAVAPRASGSAEPARVGKRLCTSAPEVDAGAVACPTADDLALLDSSTRSGPPEPLRSSGGGSSSSGGGGGGGSSGTRAAPQQSSAPASAVKQPAAAAATDMDTSALSIASDGSARPRRAAADPARQAAFAAQWRFLGAAGSTRVLATDIKQIIGLQ